MRGLARATAPATAARRKVRSRGCVARAVPAFPRSDARAEKADTTARPGLTRNRTVPLPVSRRALDFRTSIKQRIHKAHLKAPDIASLAILGFFLSVKYFPTDAQAFAKLPHQVETCVMGVVICIRPLGCLVVEVHVAVGRGGAQHIRPLMSIADRCSKAGDGFQIARR